MKKTLLAYTCMIIIAFFLCLIINKLTQINEGKSINEVWKQNNEYNQR